jgi:hypothetical protein
MPPTPPDPPAAGPGRRCTCRRSTTTRCRRTSNSTSLAPPSRASWVNIRRICRSSTYTNERRPRPDHPSRLGHRPRTSRTSTSRTLSTSPTGWPAGMASLFRHRDFALLWAGESVSELGSAVTYVAFPLVAVARIHPRTASPGKPGRHAIFAWTTCGNAPFPSTLPETTPTSPVSFPLSHRSSSPDHLSGCLRRGHLARRLAGRTTQPARH